ncbi:MAG TPA: M14 family metallopeptidase [Gemmatimonadales bacterium]|nr:M14 family metallopeptidase [Gemmatimonadales bacterium]
MPCPLRAARTAAFLAALMAGLATPAAAQQTRAERTGYAETSSLADVAAFLDTLATRTGDIRVGRLTTSIDGRVTPLVVASRPLVADAGEAHRSGKPMVYLQANIHAGEVEGKEAVQALLRDLTLGPLRPLLDSLVLLVVPVYNADGNEAWAAGEENRPGQNGPALVGRRSNGQGLDLNRDYVKQEAPETRAAAAILAEWDPDLFVDLHTTNGSYHGYALTFSPGLNPNEGPANRFVRDRLLPEVRRRMKARHGYETFWYGNFRNQEPDSLTQGWETYEGTPRYGTNWVGLRGRMAVLSEAYSNADFRTRVLATYAFVREVLGFAAERAADVKAANRADDRDRPDSVGVRLALAPPVEAEVIAEITHAAGDGSHGFARRQRSGVFRRVTMPVYDRFIATRHEAVPAGYLLPSAYPEVAALLRRHGIAVERLGAEWRGPLEGFVVDSVVPARGPFEGHRATRVEGAWRSREGVVPAGWYWVSTDQPRGLLAAWLLEPASEDGVVTWNLLDRGLRPRAEAPVRRLRRAPEVPRAMVDAGR